LTKIATDVGVDFAMHCGEIETHILLRALAARLVSRKAEQVWTSIQKWSMLVVFTEVLRQVIKSWWSFDAAKDTSYRFAAVLICRKLVAVQKGWWRIRGESWWPEAKV